MHEEQLNSCSQTPPAAGVGESLRQFQCKCHKLWQCTFPKGTEASAAAEWDSRSSFPPSSPPCTGPSPACSSCRCTHPASLDSGCLQHGQLYCLRDGTGRILTDLSCRYQSQLVKRLLSRWHKQALFGNPFLAQFLVIGGKYFLCFLTSM